MKTVITIEAFMADITGDGPNPKVTNHPCADIYIKIGDLSTRHSVFCDTEENNIEAALPKFVEMAADLIRNLQKEKANAPDPS